MKNGIRLIIASACAMLFLNGCSPETEWDSVMISEEKLIFSAEAGSRTVSSQGHGFGLSGMVEDDRIPTYQTRHDDPYLQGYYSFVQGDWMTVEVTRRDGETPMEMTVTVEKNDTGKERDGYITLHGRVSPCTVLVYFTQLAE